MSISASYGWEAVVMSNSSWGSENLGRVKNGRKMQEGRTLRVRPSRKLAEFSASAASSDMAQPIIVAGATTHGLAQMGPGADHGARQYMRMAGFVKRELLNAVMRERVRNAGIDRFRGRDVALRVVGIALPALRKSTAIEPTVKL